MNYKITFLGIISFLFFSFLFEDEKIKIGEKVNFNNMEYKNIDSKLTSIEKQFERNGLILVFSCNTCPFVVGSDNFEGWEKQYNKLHGLAKDAEIGFVLVNSNEAKRENEDSFKEMQNHAKKNKYTMHYLLDENSELANLLHAKTTPHIFTFNTLNELVYSGTIDNTWDTKREKDISYLENVIQQIKDNKQITVEATDPRGCSIKRVKSN
jgi:hypothetical protein